MTPWTVAHQAPLSMEIPRQEYWSGLLFPTPGDLSDPGIQPVSPALAGAGGAGWWRAWFFTFFTAEPLGKSKMYQYPILILHAGKNKKTPCHNIAYIHAPMKMSHF